VAGVDVASMGALEPELESDQVFQIIEERRHAYRKLVIRNGRLVGAMLVGNTLATAALVQSFDRGDPLPDDPLELLCQQRGSSAASERIVCSCHKVSDSTLCAAIDGGADSMLQLGELTKAGTGCGSCKTEIGQLLALRRKPMLLDAAS
jgi:nitrite reductase (NADH) large subunit